MPKIVNERYNEFIKDGVISLMDKDELAIKLKFIKSKYKLESRALFILMYYTGARPAEVLNLTAGDISKEKQSYLCIKTRALKNGLPRTIRIRYRLPFIKEVWDFSIARPEQMYLFPHFRSKTVRTTKYTTAKGEKKEKQYVEVSNKLRYHFNKWFKGELNPYFMRHNRFSKIMENGGTMEDVMFMKGSKSMESVRPYAHMSKKKSQSLARKVD